ncbi:hypothetical protein OIU84_018525 [Salix udensis]|uniref:Uncharacterized protein n=1 Tax=Salix udensis TaxID=889485 RepID=A0AAD6PIC4_9ROSI|nr:hypothetical protein OIU84_018525 [Salix udensis]
MLSACTDHLLTQPTWLLLVSSLGFLSFLKTSTLLLHWVHATFLRPEKNLKEYGSWAVITGATDGIGKAFAHQLAQKGSKSCSDHPGIKIKAVPLDFSSKLSARAAQGVIAMAVEGLSVGLLINNVGITYPAARFFHEVDEKVWMEIVRVNVEGTSRVTRAVLTGMIRRRRGAIVNIGSGASTVMPSHPLFTIYAATKAYIDQLSRCLNVEYKRYGIHVQCQVPLYVATKMASKVASIRRSSLFIPAPEDYAKAAIGRIGYEARCAPYWAHSFQWWFAELLPDRVLDAWRLSVGIHRRGKLVA